MAALAGACGQHPKNAGDQALAAEQFPEPAPRDRYADDVARFLAGLPAKSGSPMADLQRSEAWANHRNELDRAWSGLERGPFSAMRAFQEQELGSPAVAGSLVFYPFSGPDALMVTVFFPHSPTYVMVGLEPAGTLPALRQLGQKDLGKHLERVRATLASELDRSFFITRQMDREFRGQVTDGLFQPILELLVRTNHTILGFRFVRLDDAGRMVERAASYRAPGRTGNQGVEIDFRTDGDQSVHKLVYFSVNLANDRLEQNKPFLRFASRLKGAGTFLKATSYMLHKPEFSIIRDQILSASAAILQDDSGIPYRFFARGRWRVQLYGDYVRPYGSFRWLEQPDLRNAYLKLGPKPLAFRIGYGYGRAASNLLFARKMD